MSTIKATAPKGQGLWDYSHTCQRCGRRRTSKGAIGSASDGLSLCSSCRMSDKDWQRMAKGGGFRPTTDEELAALEAEDLEEAS